MATWIRTGRLFFVALGIAAFSVAGCGDDDDDDSSGTGPDGGGE